jgi:hypothetical protein
MKQQQFVPVVSVPSSQYIDPFSRPAGEVTVEEWRILICGIAGRLRLSHGFSRTVIVPAGGTPVLIAQNDKSHALFVNGRQFGAAFVFAIGGDSRTATFESGIVIQSGSSFEQILLPKERIYATSTAGGTLVVTEVTV